MANNLKILHLEDLPSDAELVERELRKGNLSFEKKVVNNRKDFAEAIKNFHPDVILSDHSLPSFNSVEALQMVKEAGINVTFILVTATVSEEFAVSILQKGGDDYILKGNLSRLPSAITQAIEKHQAIAAKVTAEKQLKVAHERLLFHLENSPLGYIEWDANNIIHSLSKRAEKIFGWGIEEFNENRLIGKTEVHPDDMAMVTEKHRELLNGITERNQLQFRSYTKDGNLIWCEWFNSALKNEEKKVITILSLVEDITLRKKDEEALINNELRFREFFETAPEALFVVDPQSRIFVDYNYNALKLVDCSGEQLLTLSPGDISPDEQPDGTNSREKMREFFTSTVFGDFPVFEWVLLKSSGEEINCEVRLSLLANAARPLIRASVLDITKRVMLEKKLEKEKLQKQLEITEAVINAQEQERTYLGEELHDNINQILAASKLYMDHAMSGDIVRVDLVKESRNYTLSAMEEIRKLSRSLLPPSLGAVTLKEAIDDLIKSLQVVKDIQFSIDYKIKKERELDEKLSLAIFRIIQEQINNIIKHANAGNILISLKKQGNKIKLIIKDDGRGFNPSNDRHGVGLKNIMSRASLFGGDVQINSAPGEGCELVVDLSITAGME